MNVSRRCFIKVLGGSAIALGASAVGLSQCDRIPSDLLDNWTGPAAGETDPRRRALAYALLAPNPHNRQSWIADLREAGVITLWTDRDRLLPMTDPYSRQIMVGCGCFLETLMLALGGEGNGAVAHLFPEGGASSQEVGYEPFARVLLDGAVAPTPDPLFSQVLRRRSTKTDYDPGRPLTDAELSGIAAAVVRGGMTFGSASDPTTLARLRAITKAAWRIEIDTDHTFRESVDLMRIGADEISKYRDGLQMNGAFFWWMKTLGLMTPESQMEKGGIAREQARSFIDSQIDSTPTFAWIISARNDRTAQVDSGRSYVRANLKATELGLALAPLSQALQEFPEMAAPFADIHRACAASDGQTVQMFFRLGIAEAPRPVVRRRLDDIIRT